MGGVEEVGGSLTLRQAGAESNSNGFLDEAVPQLSPKGSVGTSRAQRQGAVSTGTAVVGFGDKSGVFSDGG